MHDQCSRRRFAIITTAATVAAIDGPTLQHAVADEPARNTAMGVVMYDCNLRRKWMKQQDASFDLFEPLEFLRHCHTLGAAGAQVGLGAMDSRSVGKLREYAEANNLFIEALIAPPKDKDDLPRFEAQLKTARQAGAKAARTVIIPGRRYEYFKTFEDFREAAKAGHAMVELAVPVVERHQVPLVCYHQQTLKIQPNGMRMPQP